MPISFNLNSVSIDITMDEVVVTPNNATSGQYLLKRDILAATLNENFFFLHSVELADGTPTNDTQYVLLKLKPGFTDEVEAAVAATVASTLITNDPGAALLVRSNSSGAAPSSLADDMLKDDLSKHIAWLGFGGEAQRDNMVLTTFLAAHTVEGSLNKVLTDELVAVLVGAGALGANLNVASSDEAGWGHANLLDILAEGRAFNTMQSANIAGLTGTTGVVGRKWSGAPFEAGDTISITINITPSNNVYNTATPMTVVDYNLLLTVV